MRVLLTGANGQAGRAIQESAPAWAEIHPFNREDLDIADVSAVHDAVGRLAPNVIVNAAAYTDVEAAESNEKQAFAVNGDGPANLVAAGRALECPVIHISTDYVFDGRRARAWQPNDATSPINAYGRSKLAGERQVLQYPDDRGLVIRTSWLYYSHAKNFVSTMLLLMRDRAEVSVVADQIAAPTWAASLSSAVWAAARNKIVGICHWRDAGVASWYDFAVAIYEIGRTNGLIDHTVDVQPVSTDEFPTKAERPAFSLLEIADSEKRLGIRSRYWRDNLRDMMEKLEHE